MSQSMEVFATEDRHSSGAYAKRPAAIVRGDGAYVWDADGKRYIDATSGQGVASLGHCHPAVTRAIAEQAARLTTCHESFYNDRRAEFCALLASATPADLNRFFLCNSGAEAIEGALKIARLITGREGIVAVKRAFHGRTTGALSMTWTPKYRKPFQSWLPQVTHVSFNDPDSAADAITGDTAAVVTEAVQGEGGVHPATDDFLRTLRERCDATGAMLVIDEIQTGLGRTGRFFAFEHAGILPDIVAMGKAIGGGLPMGVVGFRDAHGTIPRATHGSTFGGNPLVCAAGIAVLETLAQENLAELAAANGGWLMDELSALNLRSARQVRGRGLMVGVELRGRVTPVLKALHERGVLALPAGLNTLRLLPPLVISREHLAVVVEAISGALD